MNFAVALAANTYRGVVLGDPLPDRNQSDADTAVAVFLSGDVSDGDAGDDSQGDERRAGRGAGARLAGVPAAVECT